MKFQCVFVEPLPGVAGRCSKPDSVVCATAWEAARGRTARSEQHRRGTNLGIAAEHRGVSRSVSRSSRDASSRRRAGKSIRRRRSAATCARPPRARRDATARRYRQSPDRSVARDPAPGRRVGRARIRGARHDQRADRRQQRRNIPTTSLSRMRRTPAAGAPPVSRARYDASAAAPAGLCAASSSTSRPSGSPAIEPSGPVTVAEAGAIGVRRHGDAAARRATRAAATATTALSI